MSTVVISKETIHVLHLGEELVGRFSYEKIVELNRATALIINEEKSHFSMVERIIHEVCEEFKIHRYRLLGQSRYYEFSYPRQIAMALTLEFTESSLNQVRKWFNKKDHSSVLHAKKVMRARECNCPAEARVINRIRQAIKTAIKAEEKPETNGHGI